MKSNKMAKAGVLQPLEIPSRKWAHVTMNLITNLPKSVKLTVIVIFMDKLTTMVHLVACRKEVTAMEYAKLFVDQVFWLQSLPKVIIFDQDACFTSKFRKVLFDLLGKNL